ncbi:reverse transcriptase domain-containing protein [Tanacetum coccineum]
MSNTAIKRMIVDRVDAAIAAERTAAAAEVARAAATAETTRAAITVGGARGSNNTGPAAGARGPNVVGPTVGAVAIDAVPEVKGCSYPEFMKCEPIKFKGTEGAMGLTRWFKRLESVFLINKCAENDKVKYATSTLLDEALSWWNSVAQPIGIENAYKIPWVKLKKIMIKQHCPRTMVPTIKKLLERYVWGLPQLIQGNVTSFDSSTIDEPMRMAHMIMDQAVRAGTVLENAKGYAPAATAPAGERGYVGNLPLCNRCKLHHTCPCTIKCKNCQKVGHQTKDCRGKGPDTGANTQPILTCFGCGGHGHFEYQCPQINGQQQQGGTHGKVYVLGDKNAQQDPNVVTGTFLLNNHYAKILFDSGANKSFVSIALASLLNITPTTLDTAFTIELANGKLVNTNTMIQNCTLNFLNHPLKIDLMPIELESFDVIIGMEWLSQHNAKIICGEKVVHIPIDNETLVI